MIEIKSELDKKNKNIDDLKNNISDLKNNICDLKNRNLLINKYKQKILELKKELSGNEKYFNDEEKNRIKKGNEINRYKQEIQKIKKQLNHKNDTSEIKSNDGDMPYLETEEEVADRIADFHEKKGKGYVDLPILLSKLNINSSKELISNVKQLINNLYKNKQITKQVYNILNKAITYKNDS